MTSTSKVTPPWRTPKLGPLAKQAMRLDPGGQKRRKLLVLLAAYADAGVDDPSVRELRTRCGFGPRQTDTLLRRLEADGFINIERFASDQNRNRYTLTMR